MSAQGWDGKDRRQSDLTKEDMREAARQAIKEWMDEKFLAFGKWTARSLAVTAFGALIYFVLRANGWVKH